MSTIPDEMEDRLLVMLIPLFDKGGEDPIDYLEANKKAKEFLFTLRIVVDGWIEDEVEKRIGG